MKTIRRILDQKGHAICTIRSDAHVFDALQLMADKEIGALLVMVDQSLVGVFSERDYARKVILKGKSSKVIRVSDVMSSPPIFITPDETNEQGLALMSTKHIRHLPVMDGNRVVGLVSIGDLVKSVIDEQKVVISQLEKHILEKTSLT